MRKTPNRQQTILDKWRQTGFILANKLDEKEEKIFAQLNNIRNENNQKAKEIKSKEKEILEEKQNIANLTIQLKSIESENSVSQKHLFDFQAKDQHLEGVYNEILNVSLIHLKSFENLKNEKYLLNDSYFPMDKINSLSNKIKSFKIPKSVLQYTSEEKKLNKIRSFYTQKQKEFEEHEAAESIYQKMIDANQTLHQLHLQYKAVEEANESDRKERQREDELKRTYKELQENGKKKIQEEEKKLKNSFEELLGVRNTMSQKINSLQIQLEKLSNLVQITEEANQQKINEYVQKIQNQNEEIEELEHQVQELENSLRFDVETNTEPEKPKFPSMNMPQFPSYQIQQNRQQNNIANNQNNSTAQQPPVDQYKSSLHELLQRANQVYNGNFK
ncbi:hypothetical protein M9Y10_044807 [Tritrichomonas musculus]|uniref:Uncharacterized protein n=1 Tax=Tritrichomonas musculus TaxID=1915356 RepID=A0ABR2JV94_9EUKA